MIEFGLYRSLQGAGAKLRRCKYSRQGSEIGRARVLVRHRLPGRVVLPGRADRTGAVMPDLRETAILEDPLQGQEKGGARISPQLAPSCGTSGVIALAPRHSYCRR